MDNKKIAAATSAVFTYIKTQEEAAYYAGATMDAEANAVDPMAGDMTAEMAALAALVEKIGARGFDNRFSAWANAGRISQMQQNSMVNMKIK